MTSVLSFSLASLRPASPVVVVIITVVAAVMVMAVTVVVVSALVNGDSALVGTCIARPAGRHTLRGIIQTILHET